MNTTTLRGIFPEPKPIHRRNFMKENIKQLKALQGVQQDRKVASFSQTIKPNKYRNVPSKVYSHFKASSKAEVEKLKNPIQNRPVFKRNLRTFWNSANDVEQRSLGVQTERQEDIPKLYETGKIKVTTPVQTPQRQKPTPRPPKAEAGDTSAGPTTAKLTKDMQKLDLEEKPDYVKNNIKNIKTKNRSDTAQDPLQPPPTYQKGVVPKYLKEKKEEEVKAQEHAREYETENTDGLVLLPDEERKEYLRVARENYAALIKELNSMPVRNDTLKKRKRKIEIEDELKRLDEVIKIFQKPKVFVKADV